MTSWWRTSFQSIMCGSWGWDRISVGWGNYSLPPPPKKKERERDQIKSARLSTEKPLNFEVWHGKLCMCKVVQWMSGMKNKTFDFVWPVCSLSLLYLRQHSSQCQRSDTFIFWKVVHGSVYYMHVLYIQYLLCQLPLNSQSRKPHTRKDPLFLPATFT